MRTILTTPIPTVPILTTPILTATVFHRSSPATGIPAGPSAGRSRGD
jgi:hypothetical protein